MFYRPHSGCSTLKNGIDLEITKVNCALPLAVFGRLKLINNFIQKTIHMCKNYFNFLLKLFIENTLCFNIKLEFSAFVQKIVCATFCLNWISTMLILHCLW